MKNKRNVIEKRYGRIISVVLGGGLMIAVLPVGQTEPAPVNVTSQSGTMQGCGDDMPAVALLTRWQDKEDQTAGYTMIAYAGRAQFFLDTTGPISGWIHCDGGDTQEPITDVDFGNFACSTGAGTYVDVEVTSAFRTLVFDADLPTEPCVTIANVAALLEQTQAYYDSDKQCSSPPAVLECVSLELSHGGGGSSCWSGIPESWTSDGPNANQVCEDHDYEGVVERALTESQGTFTPGLPKTVEMVTPTGFTCDTNVGTDCVQTTDPTPTSTRAIRWLEWVWYDDADLDAGEICYVEDDEGQLTYRIKFTATAQFTTQYYPSVEAEVCGMLVLRDPPV